MTYNYYLNFSNNSKKISIKLYLRENKYCIVLNTKEFIESKAGLSLNEVAKKYWDSKAQKVKSNYIGSPEINQYLDLFKSNIQKKVRLYKIDHPDCNFDELRTLLIDNTKSKKDFYSVYNDFCEIKKNEVTAATIQKHTRLLNYIKEFETAAKYPIYFNTINLFFKDKFCQFLIDNKKQSNNTISKNLDFLKTFLLWAADRGLTSNFEFKKFKMKLTETDVIALTQNELEKIYNFDFSNNLAYDRVRDVFCFCCFTGQRFSDVCKFKFSDVKDNVWNLRQQKTKDVNNVPLTNNALAIIDKYQKQGLLKLPTISNQKTNSHLKNVMSSIGINDEVTITSFKGAERIETTYKKYELIGTHTARRTFITLSLEKGMRPEVVMQISGHRDYKSFKKYIKLSNIVKIKEMNEIWNDNQNKITKIA